MVGKMKISEIAKIIDGKLYNNKEDIDIVGVCSLEKGKGKHIAFVSKEKFISVAKGSEASAFLTFKPLEIDKPQIITEEPDVAFYKLIEIFNPDEEINKNDISNLASIHKSVKLGKNVLIKDYVVLDENVEIGDNVKIYPFVYIGKNVKIGSNVIIYPNVAIYKDTEIGNNVIIHSGAKLGVDGFGYYIENGIRKKIKHIGKLIIKDNVEIGANTTIDRAVIDETIIGENTKIDDLVLIAHNCKVGDNSVLVGQVGIAGSVNIGDNVILAGQVGVADHLNICDNVFVAAKSGIGKDIKKSGIYGSNIPAIEWKKWKRILFRLYSLADEKKQKRRKDNE